MTTQTTATDERAVLVVDDDSAVLNSLRFSLGIEGFDVRVFQSDQDLLTANALPERACLVVDYNLPHGNGLDLVAALRARGQHFPAILITSDPSTNVRRRAAAAGVVIIEKPLLTDALIESINRALS